MAKSKRETYRNGDVTLGQREDGEAVADFRDEDAKRRRVRLGVLLADFEAAKVALDRFADNRRTIRKTQEDNTVGKLWSLWMKDRAEDGFSNDVYKHHWTAMAPTFENRLPYNLEDTDFRTYARSRFADGMSAWTVHTEMSRLGTCLKWAFEKRKTPILIKVWVPSPGKARKRVLTIDEARALVRAAEQGDPHVYLFVVLLFATGARHMAILDLTWDRIDFERGTIQYDEELPRDPMNRSYRKGRATVPMNDAVRAALKVADAGKQTDHVIEHGGKRLKSVREGFAFAVLRAGLGVILQAPTEKSPNNWRVETDVTPHTIRHTVSTWLDAVKIEDKHRAQLLGHANPTITNAHYTHRAPELLQQAVSELGAAFAPLPKIDHEAAPETPKKRKNPPAVSQRDNPITDGAH